MSGSKSSYAVTQLESQGVLNPGAHIFVQEEFYQEEPTYRTSTSAPGSCGSRADADHTTGGTRDAQVQ